MKCARDTGWAVEAEGVSFVYPEGTTALDGVDFRVKTGEFVALLASNGSGKSTLIRVLAGLLPARKGTVRIAGRDIRRYSTRALYREIGVVFQDPDDQLFCASVEEDVAFGPRNLGLSPADVEARVSAALGAVGASGLRARAVHHLSFGEKKRVAVAGVLAMEPSTLVLDEATAGLDPAGEALMMRLLNRLNRERRITVVLATHSVDLLPLFADRICVLQRGKVLKEGTAEAIFRDHEMIERAGLRLPYVSGLLHDLKRYDGVPIEGLPLTVGEARTRLLELIPEALIVGKRLWGET